MVGIDQCIIKSRARNGAQIGNQGFSCKGVLSQLGASRVLLPKHSVAPLFFNALTKVLAWIQLGKDGFLSDLNQSFCRTEPNKTKHGRRKQTLCHTMSAWAASKLDGLSIARPNVFTLQTMSSEALLNTEVRAIGPLSYLRWRHKAKLDY